MSLSFGLPRGGLRTLTLTQARLLLREPVALVWLGVPLLLVLVFGNLPAFQHPDAGLGGRRLIDVYVPTLAAMVPLFLACTALPMTMAGWREKDVLRRLAVSPVPAAGMLAGLVSVIAALAVAGVAVITAVGVLAFGVALPGGAFAVLSSFLLGSAAVLALGMVIAARARTGGAASGLGVPLMVLNFFASGLYTPVEVLPRWLQQVCEVIPFGAVTAAWAGRGPLWQHLLVLAGWTVLGSAVAARTFRWE